MLAYNILSRDVEFGVSNSLYLLLMRLVMEDKADGALAPGLLQDHVLQPSLVQTAVVPL